MDDCEHWVYDYICSVYECTQCKGEGCKDYKKHRNPFTEMTEEQLKRTLEYQAWKTNRRACIDKSLDELKELEQEG